MACAPAGNGSEPRTRWVRAAAAMSPRWKLLRFQTAEKLLPAASAARDGAPSQPSHALSAGRAPAAPSPAADRTALLRQFASACDGAAASHAAHGVYALLLSRGAVEVFLFPAGQLRRADAAAAPPAVTAAPAHFVVAAHESCVTAVRVVAPRAEGELPMFVTVGLDSKLVSVKLWRVSELPPGEAAVARAGRFVDDTAAGGEPRRVVTCAAALRMPSEAQPSAVAVLGGERVGGGALRVVAVGFDDASVVVFQGDLLRERYTRVRVAQAPGEMRDARPVTFLAFCQDDVMVVTEQSVAVLRPLYDKPASPSGKDGAGERPLPSGYEREALDSRGALEGHTVAHVVRTDEIVVAREEALYFFNKDGRGQCLAFPSEGSNACIAAVGPYVVHAAMPNAVVVYDVTTKVIAYRGTGNVRDLFADEEKRSVLLVMTDKSLVLLEEVPLESRVHTLVSRGMYSAAISMAKAEGSESSASAREQPSRPSALYTSAVRQYAEFLMGKSDYDSAAAQLIGTIGGSIEPSWVITRLVEQPGLRSGLRSYLEALHYAGEASFVHTRVLITCYRHDRARAAILQTQTASQDRTADEHIIQVLTDVDWSVREVDMAIDLCCNAGLYGVAESVARRRGRIVRLAQTLVEHLDNVPAGLDVLKSVVDRGEAFDITDLCGRKMLAQEPKEFVSIAADMISCSGSRVSSERGDEASALSAASSAASSVRSHAKTQDPMAPVTHLARLFVDRPRWLASLLESVVTRAASNSTTDEELEALWLMLFEALTRVDMDRSACAPTGRSALKVLQSRMAKINLREALVISERYGHNPCLEYIYEHLRMYRELAQHLRITNDNTGMVRACRRHGKREPLLWLEAVRLFSLQVDTLEICDGDSNLSLMKKAAADTGDTGENVQRSVQRRHDSDAVKSHDTNSAREYLQEAILALDSSGMMSPAEIVEAVCLACPRGHWSIARSYFEQIVGRLTSRAKEEEAAAAALGVEALGVRSECTRLGEAVIVKPKFCGVCDDILTAPSVHFFCNHSYHVACVTSSALSPLPVDETRSGGMGLRMFGGIGSRAAGPAETDDAAVWAEMECPLCAPELDAVMSMRNALEEKNGRHDDFYRVLQSTKRDGGFDTVISFLSRSPFLNGV
jgi:hypothetical protein